MRRFELVEGSSSKFWEIELDGWDVTVRFGRIGTQGQAKTKSLASDAAARKEHDKLVKEKTGKGYAEVAVAAGATLAAVAAPAATDDTADTVDESAASAPASGPAVAPLPPAAVVSALPTTPAAAGCTALPDDASSASIVWPTGGFQWTPDLRADLPTVRGVRAIRAAMLDSLSLDQPPDIVDDDYAGYRAKQFGELARHVGRPWRRWEAADWAERLQRAKLQSTDPETWLEMLLQSWVADARLRSGAMPPQRMHLMPAWVTAAGLALHGLSFMVERALDVCRVASDHQLFGMAVTSMLPPLREGVAAADDATHDAAIAVLEQQAGAEPALRVARAYLAAHRADWAIAARADRADRYHLLLECAQPAALLIEGLRGMYLGAQYLKPALLLQVHLHQEAAFPLLAHVVREAHGRDNVEKFVSLAARMQVPAVVDLLAELIERKEVQAALDRLSERYPAAVLKTVVERAFATRSRLAEGWAVRLALREPAAWAAVRPVLSAADRERFEALLAALRMVEAPAEQLPPLLREPPWLRKARATDLPTLAVAPRPMPERLVWTAADQSRHATFQVPAWRANQARSAGLSAEDFALKELHIAAAARARLLAGEPLRDGDVKPAPGVGYSCAPDLLLMLPDAVGLALWNGYPAMHWRVWGDVEQRVCAVMARFGEAALPGLANFAQVHPEVGLGIALVADSLRIVPTALHALRNLKKAKPMAIDWLRAHPRTALAAALPLAFGSDRVQRDNAQAGVRWLAANGFEAEARSVAAGYGDEMAQALQALLDADPLLVLPSRMPKLPAFFVAASFRRPLLREGGAALGTTAVEHIGTMLAISQLEAPYPGLDIVRAACTPASLAEFAWDVFEAWQAAGAPSKEGWAFVALGLFGDDETARRLAPRIREWPGESQHQRAVLGLDLLAAIGSDVALMHLNGIAGKVKFKALQERAREKIAAVAEARGFTAAELADRLVPDLGLDDDGTLRLDFGPRHFTVAFDEALKPFVRDAQGVRLKDLPKPLKSDDAARADAATERYKQVKKDAKAVASLQVVRLEMAMVERRRWPAADFRLFFLEHPLMRHLAARLVWGVYDGHGQLCTAFRVAEDFSLADADDTAYELPAEVSVGIAHVLEMPQPLQAAFGQVFADYEILQPFRQLGREIYALTAEERLDADIKRYAGKMVSTGSVMGLVNRGWERGEAQDAGWVGWFTKRVAGGLEVQMNLDPGTVIGDPSYEPRQRIPSLTLRAEGTWGSDGRVNFGLLDPITASELLRDADLLAPIKE
jgi:predicted DNA-binding WGR domain protein